MDYSKFLYDPFGKDTVSELEKYDEFQFECKDKAKVVAYLILMYDINNTEDEQTYAKKNIIVSQKWTKKTDTIDY